MKFRLISLLLVVLGSSEEVRVLRGHLGRTVEEAKITYECSIILSDVVYSMLNKFWYICPYIDGTANVDKCMNKCVSKSADRKRFKFAKEEDILSYIKQCPSITLLARNTLIENRDVITTGGQLVPH